MVLKSDGKMVTKNGRETIKSLGSNAVKEWITSTLVFETVSSTTKINSECKSNGEGSTNTKFNCFKNMQLDELEPGESGNSQFYCEMEIIYFKVVLFCNLYVCILLYILCMQAQNYMIEFILRHFFCLMSKQFQIIS